MAPLENQDFQKEIKKWVTDYYIAQGFLRLRKAVEYSQKYLMKGTAIGLGLLVGYCLILIFWLEKQWTWLGLAVFILLYWLTLSAFRRKSQQ
jgi:hypothetical protein